MTAEENFQVNSSGKNCICCPYLLKAYSYLFKRVNIVFLLFGKWEDKCLQATHKAATIPINKSGRTSLSLLQWIVSNVFIPSNQKEN